MRFGHYVVVVVLAAVVATGTSCSSKSGTKAAECPSVQTDLAVSDDVVLNHRIRDTLAIDSELRKAYILYENRDNSGGVLIVDLDKHEVTDDVAFSEGVGGAALALDPKAHLLYVTEGEDTLAVLNGGTGERVRSIDIQDGAFDMDLDPDHGMLYLVSRQNELRAVHAESGDVIATIDVPFRPSEVGVDVANRVVYTAATGGERGGFVAAIDGSRNVVASSAEVKGSDGGLAPDSEHHRVYASSSYYGVVSVIDGKTGDVTATFPDFETPHSMALCGGVLFVANRDPGELVVADAATGQTAQKFRVGYHPEAMAVDKATGNLWVLSAGDVAETTPGLLSVITPKG